MVERQNRLPPSPPPPPPLPPLTQFSSPPHPTSLSLVFLFVLRGRLRLDAVQVAIDLVVLQLPLRLVDRVHDHTVRRDVVGTAAEMHAVHLCHILPAKVPLKKNRQVANGGELRRPVCVCVCVFAFFLWWRGVERERARNDNWAYFKGYSVSLKAPSSRSIS